MTTSELMKMLREAMTERGVTLTLGWTEEVEGDRRTVRIEHLGGGRAPLGPSVLLRMDFDNETFEVERWDVYAPVATGNEIAPTLDAMAAHLQG
jgi:hypothetical protein